MNVSIPKKYPEAPTKKRALDSKNSIQSPLLKKNFSPPRWRVRGARGSGFARAIAPVPTNFQGGFTALLKSNLIYSHVIVLCYVQQLKDPVKFLVVFNKRSGLASYDWIKQLIDRNGSHCFRFYHDIYFFELHLRLLCYKTTSMQALSRREKKNSDSCRVIHSTVVFCTSAPITACQSHNSP